MENPEQKPSGNPELIEQHKRKQRMGSDELAKKPGNEPDEDTTAGDHRPARSHNGSAAHLHAQARFVG